ncbi:MAG: hypothetical protein OEV73_00140 [Desulfobulbaceae bacterium]|nr:hypothetical protein [Desulfobulbaceae bacterium]
MAGQSTYNPGEIRSKSAGSGLKATAAGVEITDDILAKINRYALEAVTAEAVFVRKQLLAHNGVDRDRERFNEALLDDFATTLPGKSTLYFHARRDYLPLGLYFDATTEQISPEKFKELTGEDPRLPDGVAAVKVLWAWYYVIKTPSVEDILANINGGTYRHWSISFIAADMAPVKGKHGETMFWEYTGPGEATEGSLVWLGAQQGATSQKSAKSGADADEGNQPQQRGKGMNALKKMLGAVLGKSFGDDTTDDQITESVKSVIAAKDAKITELTGQVEESKAMAALGKQFQDGLIADYVRMKAALGEIEQTEEAKTKTKGFAATFDVEFLGQEVKGLQKRMNEKFPDGGQLEGDDRRDKSADSTDAAFTGSKNPLVPRDSK